VAHVARANASGKGARGLLRPLDRGPELVLREIVGGDEAGHAVLARLGAQQPARWSLTGQRPVNAAERLNANQVSEHQQIERKLKLEFGLDLGGRLGCSARFVVLNQAAGGKRVEVDAVDLSRDGQLAEIETALADAGAFTYRDYSAGTTLVWLSYPADTEVAENDNMGAVK